MDLHIRPLERTLRVEAGVNLLEALRAHDIPVSYSCLAGRCGTCRCKVVAGQVLEAGGEQRPPQALEAADTVLACQTFITEDCTVEIAEPDEVVVHTARIVKATVVGIDAPTHDIRRLRLKPAKVLVDGNRLPPLDVLAEAIVSGDALVPCISAASILAKVTRDRGLQALHDEYPQYGFDQHKGYGTAQHLEALRRLRDIAQTQQLHFDIAGRAEIRIQQRELQGMRTRAAGFAECTRTMGGTKPRVTTSAPS